LGRKIRESQRRRRIPTSFIHFNLLTFKTTLMSQHDSLVSLHNNSHHHYGSIGERKRRKSLFIQDNAPMTSSSGTEDEDEREIEEFLTLSPDSKSKVLQPHNLFIYSFFS